jgi:alkylation response protein AidB-like acyl-CoA dehydrogenase
MQRGTLPGSGPWSWLEPGLWVYRSRELDLLGEADRRLEQAVPAARAGGAALLAAKRHLHAAGIGAATAPADAGGGGHRFVVQVAIQFLAGYHELNLRDAASVGHGAILCHDPEWRGRRELAEVIEGGLVGLAATEPSDDPSVEGVSTLARPVPGGFEITGRKKWISRIVEADAFVVFARSPEHLSAFHVPARTPGLRMTPVTPAGLTGWSWGELALEGVRVPAAAVVGATVGGVAVFRRHFTEYRPLVAATCLGAAASCIDAWVEHVVARSGDGRSLSSGVSERLGDLRGRVLLALSGLITGAAHPGGMDSSWSKLVKAQSVETALDAARTAARNMGSECFEAEHPVRRVVRDLEAFEYADGSIDPLLGAAGQRFVQYSAAILDEISEPTSTMVRPRLPD